jgi:hypothetical protein
MNGGCGVRGCSKGKRKQETEEGYEGDDVCYVGDEKGGEMIFERWLKRVGVKSPMI